MWPQKVDDGSDRHDAGRVDGIVRHVVVAFDVIEIHRRRDARLLIKVHQVALEVWVIEDAPEAAFEVDVIDHIEADEVQKSRQSDSTMRSPKR